MNQTSDSGANQPSPASEATPPHVVMVSHGPIERDARIRKSSHSVLQMGYRVTVVYGDPNVSAVTKGQLDGVETLAVPLRLYLAGQRGKDLEKYYKSHDRLWRWFHWGYRHSDDRRVAERRLILMAQRRYTEPPGKFRRRWMEAVHKRRTKWFFQEQTRRERRRGPADKRRLSWNWRRELAIVGDYEATITPWIIERQPDIIHVHDVHTLWGGVNAKAYWQARGRRVALVYDAHEYVAGWIPEDPFLQHGFSALELEAVPYVDASITVCEPIADLMYQHLPLDARPTVVLNAPPLDAATVKPRGQLRAEVGLDNDTPLVVYTGDIKARRNLKNVIAALPDLPGVHLAVVGVPFVTGPLAGALSEAAGQLGVADRFHLVNPVAPEEVVAFVASATVGIAPFIGGIVNHELSLPNKLFDYLLAGIPVAVSDLPEMGRVVRQYGIGHVFDPLNPGSIAQAIRQVLDNYPALLEAVRQPALREVFSWEAQESKLQQLYGDVVGELGKSAGRSVT